jgi:release factor glutamine methyltransferase
MSMEVWTIGRLLDWTAKYLAEKGSEFPRLDAEVLLAHTLGCPRIQLYVRSEEPAGEAARNQFKSLIRQRVEGCPVAYLVGQKEFFSLTFEVNRAVLIPRPDTEVLVVETLRLARPRAAATVLDVGTGSGAIALALLKNHPGLNATAVDISGEALAVAERNARRHGVAERIVFVRSDLFDALPAQKQFDFIVSNPPYIPTDAMALLPAGVRDFEPKTALDGGPGGYKVIERLMAAAPAYLRPDGCLLLEIGVAQEAAVRERMARLGVYQEPCTVADYAGHPRVLRAQLRN